MGPCFNCGKALHRGQKKYCSYPCSNLGRSVPMAVRFWQKVIKTDSCWLWTGATLRGYGLIARPGHQGGYIKAPRFSWELSFGKIPSGLCVLHHCDNPRCVRPEHLFLGSQADNRLDMVAKNRHSHGEQVPSAKLTEEDVIEIRVLHRTKNISYAQLAREFKIASSTAWNIANNVSWKHLS